MISKLHFRTNRKWFSVPFSIQGEYAILSSWDISGFSWFSFLQLSCKHVLGFLLVSTQILFCRSPLLCINKLVALFVSQVLIMFAWEWNLSRLLFMFTLPKGKVNFPLKLSRRNSSSWGLWCLEYPESGELRMGCNATPHFCTFGAQCTHTVANKA